MRSPTFTMVAGGMLLARAISASDLWYLRDSAIRVSPGATTCTTWLVVWGALTAGAGRAGATEATRGVVEPVASYFGITRCWPGRSAVPFGRLLASAMAEAGTPYLCTRPSMVSPGF